MTFRLPKYFSISNILTALLLLFFLFRQAPTIIKNFQSEGIKISSREYSLLHTTELKQQFFPAPKGRSIAIFWATWCGPCSMEMKRLETSVIEGKIPANSIFAINPFESADVVKTFLKTHPYPFQFLAADEIAEKLNINSTPTTLFLEDGKIISMSSGISVLGILKAEKFLNNN